MDGARRLPGRHQLHALKKLRKALDLWADNINQDGTSAYPMPAALAEVDFCDRHHWTWWEYYTTPQDVIARWRLIDRAIDRAKSKLQTNNSSSGSVTLQAMDDSD